MNRKQNSGGAKLSELQKLQSVVTKALLTDIQAGMKSGEIPHSSVKNALQLLRDNNVTCVDDLQDDVSRLKSLLPPLDLSVSTTLSKRE